MISEQFFGSAIGRGLIAVTDIQKCSVLFEEEPLVQIQYSWNKKYNYTACEQCMKPLEDVDENLKRLTGDNSLIVPYKQLCVISSSKSSFCNCEKCGAKYCSKHCLEKALTLYHNFLCPSNGYVSKEFLDTFETIWNEIHYPPETSNIMILVKMVAMVQQAENKENMINMFASFCQSTFNESDFLVHKILNEKYASQIKMLFEMFKKNLYTEQLHNWFTYEGFQNLIALVCRNAQGIATSSFSLWLNIAESHFKNNECFENFVENVYEKIDEHVGSFIDNEGIGLYQKQSLINHSCRPNCEIKFSGQDSKLSLIALRNISKDEQLFISYLDECQLNRSRHSRQKYLKEYYLFNCQCEKCLLETDEPDETSDEEESDEMME